MDLPVCSQTPRQKFPSCGGRTEFMISVLSACHTARALSMTVSGMSFPLLVLAVKITCHIPTIDGPFFLFIASRSHDVRSTHLWMPRRRFRELRRHSALRQGARNHRPRKYQRA